MYVPGPIHFLAQANYVGSVVSPQSGQLKDQNREESSEKASSVCQYRQNIQNLCYPNHVLKLEMLP